MSLFGRQVVVQIGTPGSTGREIRGLRVSARVEMHLTGDPNHAVIQVYNASADTIAHIQKPTAVVRLLAGYETARLIFKGSPVKGGVKLEKQGPDRVLTIEAADGGREYSLGRLNVSFATQTTARQAFEEVADQLGLAIGKVEVGSIRYPHGKTLSGPARAILDDLAVSADARWHVRDGVLYVTPRTGSTGESAVVFGVDNKNLVGSPTPKDKGIEIKALLDPAMRPGRPFRVQSEQFNGIYVAKDVEFELDSGWEQPFYVNVYGVPR